MYNPFEKRATEYVRDEEAFLAMVTPAPVMTFLGPHAAADRLFDRLVFLRGAPGSGKTTLARLFQYRTVVALLRRPQNAAYKELMAALSQCRALSEGMPIVAGCRLPIESEYREIWDLPYAPELRARLLSALIQARAVLAWLRGFRDAGLAPTDVRVSSRGPGAAAIDAIGGASYDGMVDRATEVEAAVYRVCTALVVPDVGEVDALQVGAYRPFDVIGAFVAPDLRGVSAEPLTLQPLVILDDAHHLHPEQLAAVQSWLKRRELRVARWILSWLDVLDPTVLLRAPLEASTSLSPDQPGVGGSRDQTDIYLQSAWQSQSRPTDRRTFRTMALDMAARYLHQMPLFSTRRLGRLEDLLETARPALGATQQTGIRRQVQELQERFQISRDRRQMLEEEVRRYVAGSSKEDLGPDVQMAILRILLHRYAVRTQPRLFSEDPDPDPTRPIRVDSGVAEGARIQLMHEFGRPYYYGAEALCDASSENAEQFLRLASGLIEIVATQITRGKPPSLSAATQHSRLRDQAHKMLSSWSFAQHAIVRSLVGRIAERCVRRTLEPNAPLGAGANAYGIRQVEFNEIPRSSANLATILQIGVARGAFMLVRTKCKDEDWCLVELGGVALLHHGLTLRRGGFVEGDARELAKLLERTVE